MTPLILRRLSFVFCPFVCLESSSSSLVKVDILSCSLLLVWYGAVSHRCFYCFSHGCFKNVLIDLRDCMSWRLSDAALAEALCLEWPQARSNHRVGKPSRQRKWTDALYEHIRSDRPLPAGTTLQVPSWWQSGSIVPPEPGALADHVVNCRQQALRGESPAKQKLQHTPHPPDLRSHAFLSQFVFFDDW